MHDEDGLDLNSDSDFEFEDYGGGKRKGGAGGRGGRGSEGGRAPPGKGKAKGVSEGKSNPSTFECLKRYIIFRISSGFPERQFHPIKAPHPRR